MIFGTVLDSLGTPTSFGREYRVQFDDNPEAKAQQGLEGPGIAERKNGVSEIYHIGDRVKLAYQSGASYGLWFILGKER